jgi:hypothetical protein
MPRWKTPDVLGMRTTPTLRRMAEELGLTVKPDATKYDIVAAIRDHYDPPVLPSTFREHLNENYESPSLREAREREERHAKQTQREFRIQQDALKRIFRKPF